MNISRFNEILKEHYIKPLDTFYRDLYRKKYNEEPPEDSAVMMDRLLRDSEREIEIIKEMEGN